jgi:hypothetical protein
MEKNKNRTEKFAIQNIIRRERGKTDGTPAHDHWSKNFIFSFPKSSKQTSSSLWLHWSSDFSVFCQHTKAKKSMCTHSMRVDETTVWLGCVLVLQVLRCNRDVRTLHGVLGVTGRRRRNDRFSCDGEIARGMRGNLGNWRGESSGKALESSLGGDQVRCVSNKVVFRWTKVMMYTLHKFYCFLFRTNNEQTGFLVALPFAERWKLRIFGADEKKKSLKMPQMEDTQQFFLFGLVVHQYFFCEFFHGTWNKDFGNQKICIMCRYLWDTCNREQNFFNGLLKFIIFISGVFSLYLYT